MLRREIAGQRSVLHPNNQHPHRDEDPVPFAWGLLVANV